MTRHAGYLVTLEHDLSDERSKIVIDALGLIKGVIAVKPIEAEYSQGIGEDRARFAFERRLWKALKEPLKPEDYR